MSKKLTVSVSCFVALAVISLCSLVYLRTSRSPRQTMERFVELWNAGRDEDAITMMDERILKDRSRAHQILQGLRDRFGTVTVRDGPATMSSDFVGKSGVGSPPRARDLSLDLETHRFTLEFSSGDSLQLVLWLVVEEKQPTGKIGVLRFYASGEDHTFDEYLRGAATRQRRPNQRR